MSAEGWVIRAKFWADTRWWNGDGWDRRYNAKVFASREAADNKAIELIMRDHSDTVVVEKV